MFNKVCKNINRISCIFYTHSSSSGFFCRRDVSKNINRISNINGFATPFNRRIHPVPYQILTEVDQQKQFTCVIETKAFFIEILVTKCLTLFLFFAFGLMTLPDLVFIRVSQLAQIRLS